MFGRLFGSKKVPENGGNSDSNPPHGVKIIKVFELELTNMEGCPSYLLTHQLSIGSEIGNIVISDPSVSPRHATFILQQEVVSVIDHGSVSGTMVNGKDIGSGRYIILEESDDIHVGDLQIKIKSRNETVEIPAEGPPQEPLVDLGPEMEMVPEDKTPVPSRWSKLMAVFKKRPRPSVRPPKNTTLAMTQSSHAANALVRVVALIMDLLLSYVVLTIFWPFDDFRDFLAFLPATIGELLGVDWMGLWNHALSDYASIREVIDDVLSYLTNTFNLGPLLIIFILGRFLTTLFFGVSLSERLVGIRPSGNKLWARIGGVLRVLLGVITAPLLIFDLPAIVSRRTLKEVVTFTRIELRSKFVALLGMIFFLPAILALCLVAPLFEGLGPPESIVINDRIDQRVKAKGALLDPDAVSIKTTSKFFNLGLTYQPSELFLVPEIRFRGVEKKLNFTPGVGLYHKDLQRTVLIELYKTFDMKQLLGLGIKGNFFLYEKFPEIYSYVYQADGVPLKGAARDANSASKFANEFMLFTQMIFGLDLNTALEFMEMQTPLIKGPLNFRSSLMALLEYKDFEQIGFVKLGNVIFMRVSYIKRRPFDLIIPLVPGQGRIFKVDLEKKEDLGPLSSKFYKYSLEDSNWLEPEPTISDGPLDTFQVLDVLASMSREKMLLPEDQAQAIYAFYFERSAEVLKSGDEVLLDRWKKAVQGANRLIEIIMQRDQGSAGEGTPINKIHQNLGDLLDALESKNHEYLGITVTETL